MELKGAQWRPLFCFLKNFLFKRTELRTPYANTTSKRGDGLKMNRKWTLEMVRIEFEKRNCRLLSTIYESSKKKLSYIARCGHEHEISMDNFSKRER